MAVSIVRNKKKLNREDPRNRKTRTHKRLS